jgi:peptide deformylase
MMVRKVLVLGDPALRTRCIDVTRFEDAGLAQEIEDIKETLEDFRIRNGFGRGIAAIQMGIPKRIIGLNLGDGPFVLINPKITFRTDEEKELWDDCMSFPDLVVKVRRSVGISLTYQDEAGNRVDWNHLSFAESELLQHEMDHLDGILATDRALDEKSIIYKAEYTKNITYYS